MHDPDTNPLKRSKIYQEKRGKLHLSSYIANDMCFMHSKTNFNT